MFMKCGILFRLVFGFQMKRIKSIFPTYFLIRFNSYVILEILNKSHP